uniref:DUF4283 domain-containing protein n=1 Tax=Cannabis sativa TaxID=3483 RepID=A0A803PSQ8_CANSA
MARKRKVVRKSINSVAKVLPEIQSEKNDAEDSLIETDLLKIPGIDHRDPSIKEEGCEETESLKSPRSRSLAEEVELGVNIPSATQNHHSTTQHSWKKFTEGKNFCSDPKLTLTKPIVKDGRKIAQVDLDEVKLEEANWSSAIICMVLGENIPVAVFDGFIRQIWGHLGINQIARMTMGLTMVKFNDEATQMKCLRMDTIGKPIMIDKYTKDRTRVQFARVLVEMDITDNPEHSFCYLNEYGQLVEEGIDYEWLLVKCKHCLGYGHIMVDCKKKKDKQSEGDKGRKKVEKNDLNMDKGTGSQAGEKQAIVQEVNLDVDETNGGNLLSQPATSENFIGGMNSCVNNVSREQKGCVQEKEADVNLRSKMEVTWQYNSPKGRLTKHLNKRRPRHSNGHQLTD